MPKGAKPVDISGQRFGRLTAVAYVGVERHRAMWHCRCECGNEGFYAGKYLRNGETQSCGCQKAENAKRMGTVSRPRHGHSPEGNVSATYITWGSMIQRCTNPKSTRWEYYGGRGILVCERWKLFENFLADMGSRPGDGLSIDRINVNGNYEPGNCRWADWKTQANNKRPRQKKEASSGIWKS